MKFFPIMNKSFPPLTEHAVRLSRDTSGCPTGWAKNKIRFVLIQKDLMRQIFQATIFIKENNF